MYSPKEAPICARNNSECHSPFKSIKHGLCNRLIYQLVKRLNSDEACIPVKGNPILKVGEWNGAKNLSIGFNGSYEVNIRLYFYKIENIASFHAKILCRLSTSIVKFLYKMQEGS